MRRKGFEPSHPYGHMRLKHACLPFHHLRLFSIITYFLKNPRKNSQIRQCHPQKQMRLEILIPASSYDESQIKVEESFSTLACYFFIIYSTICGQRVSCSLDVSFKMKIAHKRAKMKTTKPGTPPSGPNCPPVISVRLEVVKYIKEDSLSNPLTWKP